MTEPTPPNQPAADQPAAGEPAFVPPLAGGPSYQPPTMPDITDLVEGSKGRTDKPSGGSGLGRNVVLGGVIAAVVIAGGAFVAGKAVASGPATLVDAVAAAQAGTLPCGESTGGGAAGFVTRLCGSGGAAGNALPGGPPGGATGPGGAVGGFGGRGVVGTVTAVSATSITVDTRGGSVTVAVPSTATVSRTVSGTMAAVTVGANVTIASTTDASGARTASRIAIVPAGQLPGGPDGGGPAPLPSSS
jgi:hypothetical protein